MHLNLKQIINDLLLQESVREVDAFINQRRDEIEKETLRTFFDKFKTYSGSNPDQTLAQIKVPFFKWLFNVSVEQNQNLSEQELNSFFDTSILYFNNKNKFNFNFQLNPIRPTWDAFETEVLEKTSEQREKQTEESTLVQLLSKNVNTRWVEDLSNSRVNKSEIIQKFKNWDKNSKITSTEKQENILVVEPRTRLSSKFWGNPRCFGVDVGYGVKWCTSATESGNMFHYYTGKSGSRLIYIIDLTQPDQNPWQKIAILIGRNGIDIFDATDRSYSAKGIQSHIKPEIFQIINELINKYSNTENDQYSPAQFKDLSPREKYTLFLTSLKDISPEDEANEYDIPKYFEEFFENHRDFFENPMYFMRNIIGFADNKDVNDETLMNLIFYYLTNKSINSYHAIIKHLNTPEKKSKAAEKFILDNEFQFNIVEIWKKLQKYLSNEQKRNIAEKFILDNLNINIHTLIILSEYLTEEEKRKAIEKFLLNSDSINLDVVYVFNNLSEYFTKEFKIKLIEKFLLNQNNFDDHAFEYLSDYLTDNDKRKIAEKFILNSNKFNEYIWKKFSKYLSEEEKQIIKSKFNISESLYKRKLKLLKLAVNNLL